MNTIENIKLKNQSKVRKIKRIFATLLASMVVLITATMNGSVWATVPNTVNYIDIKTTSDKGDTGNTSITTSSGGFVQSYAVTGGDAVALVYISSSSYVRIVFVTEMSGVNYLVGLNTSSNFRNMGSINTYRNGYYYAGYNMSSSDSYVYNNMVNLISDTSITSDTACVDYAIDNWDNLITPDIPPAYSSRKVEAGNVAILDFGSGVFDYDLTLTSYNYQKSGLFQGANVWNDNGQAYYWSFTLPESGDSVSGTQITWDKASSALYPRDALGQTHYGIYDMSGTGAARYLLIINPYVNKISESGQGDVNGWINIDGIPEGVGVYIYPMQQTITGLSNENVISTTEENPGGYGVATSQGGIIDTTTIGGDSPYTQTTGGANSSMPLATIGDYVEDINNTLSGFSQNFLNLLKAPIEYIKALVEGAQNFFAYIAGLFTWLPQDISAFVITGLMLVVIIGIFHSLL